MNSLLSDDGTLRVYDLSSSKVLKAVRGLGSEVSAIACFKRTGSDLRDVWLACGRRVSIESCNGSPIQVLDVAQALCFQMDSPKMILTADDALETLELGESEEDELNEVILKTCFLRPCSLESVSLQ